MMLAMMDEDPRETMQAEQDGDTLEGLGLGARNVGIGHHEGEDDHQQAQDSVGRPGPILLERLQLDGAAVDTLRKKAWIIRRM